MLRIELEDPELAADHMHSHVVDGHAVDVPLERAVVRVSVDDELRPVLPDRACKPVGAEDKPQTLGLAGERRFDR